MDVQIVPMEEEYMESFHRCLDAVARERRYLALVEAPPLEDAREFILSGLANNMMQFVALKNGEVIGWCDIVPSTREGFTHCGRLGMGVLREFRRQGIGRSLLARTLDAAREQGLERVELDVYASNTAAIRLYEKAGFVVEGVKKRARKLDGVYDHIIEMVLSPSQS